MENNVASERKVRFRCVRDRSARTLAVANLRQHEIHDLLKTPTPPTPLPERGEGSDADHVATLPLLRGFLATITHELTHRLKHPPLPQTPT